MFLIVWCKVAFANGLDLGVAWLDPSKGDSGANKTMFVQENG